jgi:hypothetical protein
MISEGWPWARRPGRADDHPESGPANRSGG